MRSHPEVVLFDLDGTISDSADGIVASMKHAFGMHGLPVPAEHVLRSFVGPPFAVALADLGLDETTAEAMVVTYRAHYNAGGLFDNVVYPGVPQALTQLQAAGVRLAVATSKPQTTARRIIEHFGLADRFEAGLDGVFGADPHRRGDTKADVIARALTGLGVTADGGVVMVGDRLHDVEGARRHGIACVGVSWGYAAEGELTRAGAVTVVDSPAQLVPYLLGPTSG